MMEKYNKLRRPPTSALKAITGGRLKGKTDINPQWRYEAMTEAYGPCGEGWRFTIDRLWTEPGANGAVFAFAQISLQTKENTDWSASIPGVGGHQLIVKETDGLYNNDEAYKMAITDALSTATKMLGVAADIYAGLWDGSKYVDQPPEFAKKQPAKTAEKPKDVPSPMDLYLGTMKKAKETLNKLTGSNDAYYQALKIYQIEHANKIKDLKEGDELIKDLRKFAKRAQEAKNDKNTATGEAPGDEGSGFPPAEG